MKTKVTILAIFPIFFVLLIIFRQNTKNKFTQPTNFTYDPCDPTILNDSSGLKRLSPTQMAEVQNWLTKRNRDKKNYRKIVNASALDRELDLRKLYVVTPIKNQIKEKAHPEIYRYCWAFAPIAAYEISYLLQEKQKFDETGLDLSEQQMINCSDKFDGKTGGFPEEVLRQLTDSKKGIYNEKELPYTGQSAPCPVGKNNTTYYVDTFDFVDPSRNQDSVPEIYKIKEAIISHGAIIAGVVETELFRKFKGDKVFYERMKRPVNHCIIIIGWNDFKKAWLIKNSFGKSWGMNGYMWIDYKSNNIGARAIWIDIKKSN